MKNFDWVKTIILLFYTTILSFSMFGCMSNSIPVSSPIPENTGNKLASTKQASTSTIETASMSSETIELEVKETTSLVSPTVVIGTASPTPTATLHGPNTETSASVELEFPIYFVTNEDLVAQIWKTTPDGSNLSLLYEIVGDESFEENLSEKDIQMLRSVLETLPVNDELKHEVVVKLGISRLALSPAGNFLTWMQFNGYCITYTADICVGEQSLYSLDLTSGNLEELLNLPRNSQSQTLDGIFFTNKGPQWSPNNQFIAMMLWGEDRQTLPIIIDINTRSIEKFSESVNASDIEIFWSPDSELVGWSIEGGKIIQLCNINTKICRDIALPKFSLSSKMDWGPYGNQIVYVDNGIYTLNLFDPNTEMVEFPIKIKGYMDSPHWSPDGKFLAADYRTSHNDFFQSLLIIEPISGQIVSQVQVEHSESEWVWGKDNETILMLTGTRLSGYDLAIFDIHDGTLKSIPLPDDLKTKQIRYPTW